MFDWFKKKPKAAAEPDRSTLVPRIKTMDTEEVAFLAAIVARPDDDLLRLVYADWLEEHGHSDRSTFLRKQVQAASGSPVRVITQAILEENVRLRAAAPAAWATWAFTLAAADFGPRLAPYFGIHDRYERGLLTVVQGGVAQLLVDLPELFRLAPLRDVVLVDYADELAQLLQLGELSRLRRLVVQAPRDPEFTEQFLLALTQSRPVSGLYYAIDYEEAEFEEEEDLLSPDDWNRIREWNPSVVPPQEP